MLSLDQSLTTIILVLKVDSALLSCQTIHCLFEPHGEKTCLLGFRPDLTQTRLHIHRRWLEAGNSGFRKKRDCTIYVVKTKALISCALTVQLICAVVFAYAKSRFSHDTAYIGMVLVVDFSGLFTIVPIQVQFFHHRLASQIYR